MAAADLDENDRFGGSSRCEISEGVDGGEAVDMPLSLDGKRGGHGFLEVGEVLGGALHGLEEAEGGVVGVLEVGFVGGIVARVAVRDAGEVFGEFDDAGGLVVVLPGGLVSGML